MTRSARPLNCDVSATRRLRTYSPSALLSRASHTAIGFREGSQAMRPFSGERVLANTPPPVAARRARDVHARLAAQLQHILQRDHRYARHRHEREPDQIPNGVVAVGPQVTESVVPLVGRATSEPAEGSVVVMRSGVDDRVRLVVVGEVRVVAAATERELQDPHSRVAELLPQRMDVRRYDPQILHDDRDRAQLALQTAEEVQTRTGYPRA